MKNMNTEVETMNKRMEVKRLAAYGQKLTKNKEQMKKEDK